MDNFDWRKEIKELGVTGAHREWWGKVYRTLAGALDSGLPMPDDILYDLARVAGDLKDGLVPPVVEKVRGPGRRTPEFVEGSDISWAVAYMRACADGRIKDTSPTKTAASKYGVSGGTARGWARTVDPPEGANRLDGAVVTDLMERAGGFHKIHGRSHSAVFRRARPSRK